MASVPEDALVGKSPLTVSKIPLPALIMPSIAEAPVPLVPVGANKPASEQEKGLPTMMKMRTELAANRLGMAQQEEADRLMAALGTAPGANVQAGPGAGLAAEAALGSGQAQPSALLSMPMSQVEQMFRGLGAAGQEKIQQVLKMREDARKNIVPAGDGSFMDLSTMRRIENPTAQAAPIEREFNLGGFSGKLTLPTFAWQQINSALLAKDPKAAADIVTTFYPGLANQLGIPAAQPSGNGHSFSVINRIAQVPSGCRCSRMPSFLPTRTRRPGLISPMIPPMHSEEFQCWTQ